MIDLRSDTVTVPTPPMRRAMFEAEVGDDVFGEDPTVLRLEAHVADILGKEAALFVPTGVMGNQIALHVHTRPGDEVLLAERSHIYHYESGAPAALSGVQLRPLGDGRGVVTADDVAGGVRGDHDWEPRTRLLCLENTVNKAGGTVYPQDVAEAACAAAHERGLATHLDGARLWNAAVASGRSEADLAAPFDTVNVCLSKGLGAPVGSVLAGPTELMTRARRVRKMLGGGMRQVGILAAAGLYAIEHHRATLAADHARARRLAEGLAALPAVRIDPETVETNIVIFDTLEEEATQALGKLETLGVRMVAFGPRTVRATTHHGITDSDIEETLGAIREVFG